MTYSTDFGNPIIDATNNDSLQIILTNLPNNTAQLITPQDVRDAIFTTWEQDVFKLIKNTDDDYIGINRNDYTYPIYFGRKNLNNATNTNPIMDLVGNSNDSDYYIYNNKDESNPNQSTIMKFLAGNDPDLFNSLPTLEATVVNNDRIDLNIISGAGFTNLTGNIKIDYNNSLEFLSNSESIIFNNGDITANSGSFSSNITANSGSFSDIESINAYFDNLFLTVDPLDGNFLTYDSSTNTVGYTSSFSIPDVTGGTNINVTNGNSFIINLDTELNYLENITYSDNINDGSSNIVLGLENYNTGSYNIISGTFNTHSDPTTGGNLIVGGNNINSGLSSVISGSTNENSANSSIISGLNNINNENRSIICGQNNVNEGLDSMIIGSNNENNSSTSMIIGSNNINNSDASFVGGFQNISNARFDIVVGRSNNNTGFDSIVTGFGNTNSDIGSIVSGLNNNNSGEYSIVSGSNNISDSDNSFISGIGNNLSGNSSFIVGQNNLILSSNNSSILGGSSNEIQTFKDNSENSIVNGFDNRIENDSNYNTIINGTGNTMSDVYYSLISGENNISSNNNKVSIFGTNNTCVRGDNNLISGENNSLSGSFNFISGSDNIITNGNYGIVLGGISNSLDFSNSYCGIIGGSNNSISNSTWRSIIAGGNNNSIVGDITTSSFIAGGINNFTNMGQTLTFGNSNDNQGARSIVGGNNNENNFSNSIILGDNNILSGFGSNSAIIATNNVTGEQADTLYTGHVNKRGTSLTTYWVTASTTLTNYVDIVIHRDLGGMDVDRDTELPSNPIDGHIIRFFRTLDTLDAWNIIPNTSHSIYVNSSLPSESSISIDTDEKATLIFDEAQSKWIKYE